MTKKPRRMARQPAEKTPASTPAPDNSASPAAETPKAGSKIAIVTDLLKREQGATLDEMMKATGWLSHTTRAALTGLKKKGHPIEKRKRDDVTCYHIVAAD